MIHFNFNPKPHEVMQRIFVDGYTDCAKTDVQLNLRYNIQVDEDKSQRPWLLTFVSGSMVKVWEHKFISAN